MFTVNFKQILKYYLFLTEKWKSEGSECLGHFITFLNDIETEGRFVRNYDGKFYPDDEILWNEDEPNGHNFENCVFMSDEGVYDDHCGGLHCAVCEFLEPQVYLLHGACEKEQRNVYYSAYQVFQQQYFALEKYCK